MTKSYIFIAVIITFFIKTNNVNAQCHLEDWTALKAFYENTDGDNWKDRSGWDIEIANRDNPRVDCDLNNLLGVSTAYPNDRVNIIMMPSNNINGNIPGAIENLINLQYFELSHNEINGTIPASIGNLTKLISIILNGNKLIGSVPNTIGNLNNLTQLYLNSNQLSGEIPSSIGNLNNLRQLGLNNNQFSGNIPFQVGNLTNLEELWLQGNCLSGNIPAEIGDLNSLTILSISPNKLHGCFPNNLKVLCNQITDKRFNASDNVDNNNLFDARWVNFCNSDLGSCESNIMKVKTVATNYSGNVNIETTAANILRNNYATIYNDCLSDCDEIEIIGACDRVTGFNNLSANEALWAASNAAHFIAPYFTRYQNAELSPVNIIVNYACDTHESVYKPTTQTILLGKGDGTERNSMAALDIVAHEYAHHILHSMENLNFANYGIPGAISESFSDIFGEVIEHHRTNGQNDWVFGGDVMTTGSSYNGIRSLSNPKDSQMKYQLPNTYKGEHWTNTEEVCFHNDLCGVHTNSGVHNYWFYLLAMGGDGVNDNGDAYNISGIGIEKAFDIVYENLSNHLPADVSYADVMLGSIQAAKSLYGEVSNEVSMVIDAWKAVGLDYGVQNPIQFDLVNARRVGDVMVQSNGAIDIPVQFDLTIDSLGQDVSADGLCFTLHLPEGYQGFKINQVFAPLTMQELNIDIETGEANICIDRQNVNAQKTGIAYKKILSGEPIVSAVVCIEVIDLGGEESFIEPLNISGYTILSSNGLASFASENLSFGVDSDILESDGEINSIIKISHEDCNTLGVVEVEVLGSPPFTFGLKNVLENSVIGSPSINGTSYQFQNLKSGNYELVVFDNANRKFLKEFSIEFVANVNGAFCCPNNLLIPSGISNNYFSAMDTISLSMGTVITKGVLEICD